VEFKTLFYKKILFIGSVASTLFLSGCGSMFKDFNSVPSFSDVRTDLGSSKFDGSSFDTDDLGYGPPHDQYNRASLFWHNSDNFYNDPRAKKPGDIVTVLISINDRASINNKSDIKRNTKDTYAIGASYSFLKKIGGNITGSSDSQSQGDGKIQRNEDIHLSIAAIVTKVLPNGNLLIDGSQQVRVNYEMRNLNITGIVRPNDIAGNNTISYDKIAEARISYGGRGRASEVQNTPYGQQILNRIAPF